MLLSDAIEGGEQLQSAIVGRGSQYFLRDRKDVFHVFFMHLVIIKTRRLISKRNAGEHLRTQHAAAS